MSSDRTWMHQAFPTLPPTEAEAIVAGLDEIAWHRLAELMLAPDPDGVRSGLALAYSGIIADLMAGASRKVDAHRRRWLVWHLSGGDLKTKGVGRIVTSWLNDNSQLCSTFGFPAGVKEKKRRSDIVKELLKQMRATMLGSGRPYNLSKADEDELETIMSFDSLDKK